MINTAQSFDGSLAIQSYISPAKNNKSLANFDTLASLQYSENTNNQTILRLNSFQKLDNKVSLFNSCEKEKQTDTTNKIQSNQRLKQLKQLQKWVKQAYNTYSDNQFLIRQNQENIRKFQHKIRMKKDSVIHIQRMGDYFEQKYKKHKILAKKHSMKQQELMKQRIQLSRQRSQSLINQIRSIQEQINDQKKIAQQLKKKARKQIINSNKTNPSSNQSNPYQYYPAHPQYSYGHYPVNSNNIHPYSYPHPHAHGYPHNIYNPNIVHRSQSQQKLLFQSKSDHLGELSKKHSLQQHQSYTPEFQSKKTSVNESQFNLSNPHQINPNTLLQAFAQQFGSGQITNSNSNRSNSSSNGKANQPQSPTNEHKKMPNKQTMTIITSEQDQNQNVYSETTNLKTPQFDRQIEYGFQQTAKRLQEKRQIKKTSSNQRSLPSDKKTDSVVKMDQSKIKIDFEESMQLSINSKTRRRVSEQNIKQSTIRIDGLQDQRSNQNSMSQDQIMPNVKKSAIFSRAKQQSSTNKNQIRNSSAQDKQKIRSPPKLPIHKKLRKVTEQESQLFDSNGLPRMKSNVKKEGDVIIGDIVLDKSNLKISQGYSMNNFQTISTPRQNLAESIQQINQKQVKNIPKVTQEDQDDEDFMNVNLLAVSKISKQKQFSQRDLQSQRQLMQSYHLKVPARELIQKSQKIQNHNNSATHIQVDDDFEEDHQKLQKQSKRKIRKSSGSRFSLLQEPVAGTKSVQLPI